MRTPFWNGFPQILRDNRLMRIFHHEPLILAMLDILFGFIGHLCQLVMDGMPKVYLVRMRTPFWNGCCKAARNSGSPRMPVPKKS